MSEESTNRTEPLPKMDPKDVSQYSDDRPVNMERGRELHRQAKEIIIDFRDRLMPEMPLGKKTSTALADVCTELMGTPGALRIFDNNGGKFFGGYEDGSDLHMELSPSRVDSKAEEIAECVKRAGLEFTHEQIADMATRALVYHELGHALQEAYRRSAAPYSYLNRNSVRFPSRASLTKDALRHGIAKPLLDDPVLSDALDETIESERLPVGLEHLLITRHAQEAYGLDAHDAELLRVNLTPTYRHQAAAAVLPIVYERAEEIKKGTFNIDQELAQRVGVSKVKALGYAAPYDPVTVRNIMEHTGVWESQTGDERFYPHMQEPVRRWRELRSSWDEEGLSSTVFNSKKSGIRQAAGVYDLDVDMLLGSGPARDACTINTRADGEAILRAAVAVEGTGSTEPVKVPAITFARASNGEIYMQTNKEYGGPVPEVVREVLITALAGRPKVRAEVLLDEEDLKTPEGQAFLARLGTPLHPSSH